MLNLKYLLFCTIVYSMGMFGQEFTFFSDSPNSTYYVPSNGYFNNGSVVTLVNSTKVPVDAIYKYSGINSLRIRWKSVTGGDWGVAIAEQDFIPHNFNFKDSIIFQAYTSTGIDSAALPVIYLEDVQNFKTPKQKLSQFVKSIRKEKWTRVSIPLQSFKLLPGSTDMSKIKSICFGQDLADGILRTIYFDEIRVKSVNDTDSVAPLIPAGLEAVGYNVSIKLSWNLNSEKDLAGYRVYRSDGLTGYKILATVSRITYNYNDYTGIPPKTFTYKISAFDSSGNESALSDGITASTESLSDSALLDMVQLATFKYFWDFGHPVSGLARDRFGGNDEIVTSGGSGFGLMAILAGIERGFISRQQGIDRVLKILNFLTNNAEKFHGAFSHWLNGTTGKMIPFSTYDNGGDLVETAFLVQGLLTTRQYFKQDTAEENLIRNLATNIWEGVEWDWYRKENGNYLFWHWSPEFGWQMNFQIKGQNETMITYLLAIASPTHSIPASLYHSGWASGQGYLNGNSYYGIPLFVGPAYGGPLFFAHYSFLGFDPRNKKDAYTNYFNNNRNHTLINREYCRNNPKGFPGYDSDTWGLTASDNPWGYLAHEPTNDNGTIAPTAAISSMPYTPQESIDALKSFYYEYGSRLWGTYGFKDAFNLSANWYASSYLAIDQGPIIIMIENYRSQLLWNNFMANTEIAPMLNAIGFVPDFTDVQDINETPAIFELENNYPNPFNPETTIIYTIPYEGKVILRVYDVLGNEIVELTNEIKPAGSYQVKYNAANLSSGTYFYTLSFGGNTFTKKMSLIK